MHDEWKRPTKGKPQPTALARIRHAVKAKQRVGLPARPILDEPRWLVE